MIKRLFILFLAFALVLCGYSAVKMLFPLTEKDIVLHYCAENALSPALVFALIKTESNFNADAVSKKGAVGFMQIMPETGAWCAEKMKIENYSGEMLYDINTNLRIGCWYLNYLIEKTGSVAWAIAAYNGGISNVQSWRAEGITFNEIPFEETRKYVQKIQKTEKIYNFLYREELSQ